MNELFNFGLPPDIVKGILDWVFDPESCEWRQSPSIIKSASTNACGAVWIDFLWSMYAVAKCNRTKCSCTKRVRCVFEEVLRQTSTLDTITPWCAKLEKFTVVHKTLETGSWGLTYHSILNRCTLWDDQTLINACTIFAYSGSAASLHFVERFVFATKSKFEKMWFETLAVCAAENGHVNVLEFLHSTWILSSHCRQLVLQRTAKNGHLHVLAFLHCNLKLTAQDARSDHNCALKLAAQNGHVHILGFFHDKLGLTAEDARSERNYALRRAAGAGHVDVLDFLHRVWGLTAEDARSENNDALRNAAANGHVNVLDFLNRVWKLTAEDARCDDNYALRMAVYNNHANVLKFLHLVWGIKCR